MSNEMNQQPRKRGPMGRMGRGMQPGEKPKNLKKSIKQLAQYIGKYKIAIFVVMLCAACSTVFNVAGPKILGKATTALSEGLMEKIRGTGSIDFARIGTILLFVLGLYLMSALFSFIQGWIMTGVTQKVCYQLRKEISEKINRMPMKYFESRTYGEVLSRITNDVDTLGQGLNQSITTIITSLATLIGVLIMMLSISPLMTLIALVILPISMGLIGLVTKKSQKFFRAQQEYLGHINGQVEEVYGGHLVIKAFNREKDTIEEFEKSHLARIQTAKQAYWENGSWRLEDGTVYTMNEAEGIKSTAKFKEQIIPLDVTPREISWEQKEPEEMTIRELREYISVLERQHQPTARQWCEIYLRISIPLASFFFAMIGAPLGTQKQRTSSSIGLGISIIVIFIYYAIMTLTTGLGKGGVMNPLLACIIPNLIWLGAGVFLLQKKNA